MAGSHSHSTIKKHQFRHHLTPKHHVNSNKNRKRLIHRNIYWGGGDTLITQSAPTNFHGFWTRKLLNKGETVADFREITSAEMESLKAADAKWTRPPQSFIDLWNAACLVGRPNGNFGRYNEDTGYFELNGILDITYEEALQIYDACVGINTLGASKDSCFSPYLYRTALPIHRRGITDANNLFNGAENLEVVSFYDPSNTPFEVSRWDYMFARCPKLHTINGVIAINKANIGDYFYNCKALKEIRLKGVIKNLSIADSPLLSHASVQFMVSNATNTSAITITVHPEVYAKLTDETNTEWHALLAQAATKQINFTTV